MDDIRLTSFSPFGGCGAKLPAGYLEMALHGLSNEKGATRELKDLDDAAVYKLDDKSSLLYTVDYFTPVVDDPYTFGQIVATNAMNDIYAMGGQPLIALNIVEFPIDCLDADVLAKILKGGQDKVSEAGAEVVGGHTLKGSELKYGMAVLGKVENARLCRNSTAKLGDKLVLTKPLGVGIITTAIKRGIYDEKALKKACMHMTALNDRSAKAMCDIGANACTDITGFGLIGHALGMAKASGVGLRIDTNSVPRIPEAMKLIEGGVATSAACANRSFFSRDVLSSKGVSEAMLDLLYDPQTAGGLLISVSREKTDTLVKALKKQGVEAAIIGEVAGGHKGKIILE